MDYEDEAYVTEITVVLKDEERTMRHNFLCYDPIIDMNQIREYIKEAKKSFTGDPDNVIVNTKTVIQ